MVIDLHSDPHVRSAVRRAARADEDVVDRAAFHDALSWGFVRAAVVPCTPSTGLLRDGDGSPVPAIVIDTRWLDRQDRAMRAAEAPRPWGLHLAIALGGRLESEGREVWVDRTLAELAQLAGRPLPTSLGGVLRRVMEWPAGYVGAASLSGVSRLSAGAIKARFRRRGLPSPTSYIRWCRSLAAVHVFRERPMTLLEAGHRLGWMHAGNLHRYVSATTGRLPSEVRGEDAWDRMLVRFAASHLGEAALDAWDSLDDLFVRTA